jgi:hypothetical protein
VYQAAEPVTAPDLSDRRSTGGAHWVGRLECESAVGTLAVVMRRVDAEHTFEVAATNDQRQSRHSARMVRTKRSA